MAVVWIERLKTGGTTPLCVQCEELLQRLSSHLIEASPTAAEREAGLAA